MVIFNSYVSLPEGNTWLYWDDSNIFKQSWVMFFFPVESDEMVTGELGNIGQLQAATSFDFPLVCYAPAASDWTRL